eukprot:gene16066-biopygen20241
MYGVRSRPNHAVPPTPAVAPPPAVAETEPPRRPRLRQVAGYHRLSLNPPPPRSRERGAAAARHEPGGRAEHPQQWADDVGGESAAHSLGPHAHGRVLPAAAAPPLPSERAVQRRDGRGPDAGSAGVWLKRITLAGPEMRLRRADKPFHRLATKIEQRHGLDMLLHSKLDAAYAAADARRGDGGGVADLHRRLYDACGQRHPGNVYYVFACRVAMGHFARTEDGANVKGTGEEGVGWNRTELHGVARRHTESTGVSGVDRSRTESTGIDRSRPESAGVIRSRPVDWSRPESTRVDRSRPESTGVVRSCNGVVRRAVSARFGDARQSAARTVMLRRRGNTQGILHFANCAEGGGRYLWCARVGVCGGGGGGRPLLAPGWAGSIVILQGGICTTVRAVHVCQGHANMVVIANGTDSHPPGAQLGGKGIQ